MRWHLPVDITCGGSADAVVGTTIGKNKECFTDLHFADDVVLLAEMLSVLVLALEVMDRKAHPLGLTINWAKTTRTLAIKTRCSISQFEGTR